MGGLTSVSVATNSFLKKKIRKKISIYKRLTLIYNYSHVIKECSFFILQKIFSTSDSRKCLTVMWNKLKDFKQKKIGTDGGETIKW